MTKAYREYLIPLPFTPEQYRIAQLYIVVKVSQQEATGDTAIKIEKNEDVKDENYGDCRKTEKVFFLNSKVPGVIRAVVPKKALILEEIAYNAFPICHTFYTNRAFSEKSFQASVISNHISFEKFEDLNLPENYEKNNKNQKRENIFASLEVKDEEYAKSQVKVMDICENIQNPDFDPNKIEIDGKKLQPGWFKDGSINQMVCQKFVTLKLDIFGLGWIVSHIEKQVDKVFLSAHQQMVCLYDEWKDLTMEDIRRLEIEAAAKLNEKEGKEIQ